jgi:putative membrane protein
MKIRNIVAGGAVLLGVAAYASVAQAASLQSPDSDALVAGYQVIQFDLKECQVLTGKAGVSANGSGLVTPDILKVSAKICSDAQANLPKLKALAKANDFDLPDSLPYTLTARYAALIRNKDAKLGINYLQDQISSHEDALAIFQDEAANGNNADIKAAAAEIIPTVQENLTLLQQTLAKH